MTDTRTYREPYDRWLDGELSTKHFSLWWDDPALFHKLEAKGDLNPPSVPIIKRKERDD